MGDHVARESMTVTELADAVGMTPRNVRAYQSRGLLEGPEILGRVAHYSGAHIARLLLIASLQREGFTLNAIKRLLETPSSYSAIVADRRRRFRDESTDMPATVPVSEERIRQLFPSAPDDLMETGLVWRDSEGTLVSSTTVVGVGRTLLSLGVPADLVARLQLDAVAYGRALGTAFREVARKRRSRDGDDMARVAVQLAAVAFEIAFLEAATDGGGGNRPLPTADAVDRRDGSHPV